MFIDDLIVSLVLFARHAVGTVTRPYETYRNIADHSRPLELFGAAVVVSVYFALASVIRTAAFRPFLLTRQFTLLALATAVTFILAITLLWGISRLLGGKGTLRAVALCWGYSLLPTLSWFLITSVLYVLIPPPRTERLQGVLFSIVYLVVSGTLFFWKATLAYLTLRFAMRLDLVRIIAVFALTVPVIGAYSVWMYRLGIFRIPFL
jgi:hypothetical protein